MPPMAIHTFPVPEALSDVQSVTKNTIYDITGTETENSLPSNKIPATIRQYRFPKRFREFQRKKKDPPPAFLPLGWNGNSCNTEQ